MNDPQATLAATSERLKAASSMRLAPKKPKTLPRMDVGEDMSLKGRMHRARIAYPMAADAVMEVAEIALKLLDLEAQEAAEKATEAGVDIQVAFEETCRCLLRCYTPRCMLFR